MKAYDKLHQDIKDIAIINYILKTCFLWGDKRRNAREPVARDFEDIIFLEETGKKDRHGNGLIEGDVIENPAGILMIIKYGKYEMFCPADKLFMDNIGFYVEADGFPCMPLGPTEDYAIRLGNIHTNRKLLRDFRGGNEDNE